MEVLMITLRGKMNARTTLLLSTICAALAGGCAAEERSESSPGPAPCSAGKAEALFEECGELAEAEIECRENAPEVAPEACPEASAAVEECREDEYACTSECQDDLLSYDDDCYPISSSDITFTEKCTDKLEQCAVKCDMCDDLEEAQVECQENTERPCQAEMDASDECFSPSRDVTVEALGSREIISIEEQAAECMAGLESQKCERIFDQCGL